jgi:hypothetical protein
VWFIEYVIKFGGDEYSNHPKACAASLWNFGHD